MDTNKEKNNLNQNEDFQNVHNSKKDILAQRRKLDTEKEILLLSRYKGNRWIFLILALFGGWFFTQKYISFFSGVYPFIFWTLFLVVTLWFLSRSRKLNLKKPLFIVSVATLLVTSGRFMFLSANEIKALFFPMLPFLAVFTILMALEEYEEFSLSPYLDTISGVILEPLGKLFKVPNFFTISKERLNNKNYPKNENSTFNKEILIGLLFGIPLALLLYMLLASGDSIFMDATDRIYHMLKFDIHFEFEKFFGRALASALAGLYYIALCLGLLYKNRIENKKLDVLNKGKIPRTTTKTILILINILFLVYSAIQIISVLSFSTLSGNVSASAISHHGRSGFFSLIQVMIINIAVLTYLKRFTIKTNDSKDPVTIILYSFTWLFTGGLTILSYLRMVTYEGEFGYTYMRIGVKFILAFIFITLAGILVYFINENFKLTTFVSSTILILLIIFSSLNIDSIIAKKAGDIYQTKNRIDLYYLSGLSSDAFNTLSKSFHFNSPMTNDEKALKNNIFNNLTLLSNNRMSKDPLTLTFTERSLLHRLNLGELKNTP